MNEINFGRIFVYDDNKENLQNFGKFINSRDIQIFGTDNLYKLLQYSKHITPDVMVIDIEEKDCPSEAMIAHFEQEINPEKYPIIVIKNKSTPFQTHPQIAHYIYKPFDLLQLNDILESYCDGNKHHNILLLDSYHEENGKLHNEMQRHNYSYFEVHNENAAKLYLTKNTPDIVCIEYLPDFISARHNLRHPRIFYVDRQQDITEIKKFLH